MFSNRYLLFIVLLSLFPPRVLMAQETAGDSALIKTALSNAVRFYAGSVGGYHRLYSGSEYLYAYAGVKGHPYFHSDSFQNSHLFYDGVLYPEIPLKFDIVTNEVIITGKQNRLLKLVPEKLDYFSLDDQQFIMIRKDSSSINLPEPGFYQLLYEGPLTALAARKKVPIRSLKAEDPYEFAMYDRFYVRKDSTYYPIASKKDLIALLLSKKELADKYRKISNRRFRSEMESIILNAVAEYARNTK